MLCCRLVWNTRGIDVLCKGCDGQKDDERDRNEATHGEPPLGAESVQNPQKCTPETSAVNKKIILVPILEQRRIGGGDYGQNPPKSRSPKNGISSVSFRKRNRPLKSEFVSHRKLSPGGRFCPRTSWYDFAMEAEILFIMVLALIVLGPRRLPEIGRQIGKALAELRRAKYEFTRQIEDEIRKIEEEEAVANTRQALEAVKNPAGTLLNGASEEKGASDPENKILPPHPAGTVAMAAGPSFTPHNDDTQPRTAVPHDPSGAIITEQTDGTASAVSGNPQINHG